MPNNRGAFQDLFLEDMLPELTNLIVDKYESKPDLIPQIFNFHTTDKSIEQSTTVGTFPIAREIDEGDAVEYYQPKQGFDKTYEMTKFGIGMKTTEEMVEDEKWGLISKLAKSLGKSIFEVRQTSAFNIFNNGFSATGPDGVAMFATTHPQLGGGTWSNTPSVGVDLSHDTLEQALITLSDTEDDEGKLVNFMPEILLVPPELEFTAKEIVKSVLRSDTANNTANILGEKNLRVVVCNYLTDTGAWFVGVAPDESELHYYERRPPRIESGFDFDEGNGKTKITTRYDVGYSDARGWYGST